MEFIIDTINLEEVKEAFEYLPMSGVTSNPSLVAKEIKSDKDAYDNFYNHIKQLRQIIGKDASLHIQVLATNAEDIYQEALFIKKNLDKYAYVKIPATKEGLKAMKMLKAKDKDFRITATAVYTTFQAFYALSLNVDYIAPYVNRIENLNADPYKLIFDVVEKAKQEGKQTKIVAASFKNIQQVINCLNAGAQAVTVSYPLLMQVFKDPSIDLAINNFNQDWKETFSKVSIIK